jgi:hypothetical protein
LESDLHYKQQSSLSIQTKIELTNYIKTQGSTISQQQYQRLSTQLNPNPKFAHIAYTLLPPSIYLLCLRKKIPKSLLCINLGPRVWLLVCATHLVLIGCSLFAFIAPWLLVGCDSLAASCLKCKSAFFTTPWSLQ